MVIFNTEKIKLVEVIMVEDHSLYPLYLSNKYTEFYMFFIQPSKHAVKRHVSSGVLSQIRK